MATTSQKPQRGRPTSAQAEYSRRQAAANAECGPELPPVEHPTRKRMCRDNLLLYLVTYYPESTGLSLFSADHVKLIENMETAILSGGWYAQAIYRGAGKTTLTENAVNWAISYGHASYIPIYAGEQSLADQMQRSIMLEWETNDLLAEDFPEITVPVRHLEGKGQRSNSQTFAGVRTHIRWTTDKLIFPIIPGSQAAGAIVRAKGIMGASRGIKEKDAFGRNRRPSLVIIDDFQTDDSAKNEQQVRKRMTVIRKSILKSGGHRKKVACIINGTVIENGDGMDQLTDPAIEPAFQSCRLKMVKSWSEEETHEKLWLGEYKRIREDYDADIPGDKLRARRDSTAYYEANREAMDRGCVVSWDSCFDPDWEASAIQHAYNELIDFGEEVFASECQQEPIAGNELLDELLPINDIASKMSGHPRHTMPGDCTKLVAFIDVQKNLLFYVVAGFTEDFRGFVVDYGTYPEQRSPHYDKRSATATLQTTYPDLSQEATWLQALVDIRTLLLNKPWQREDGTTAQIDGIGIDTNYGQSSSTIKAFCGVPDNRALFMPCFGRFVGATTRELCDNKPVPGEELGPREFGVRNLPPARGEACRHTLYDTNAFKSQVHAAWLVAAGTRGADQKPGALTLYQADQPHRLFAEHQHAETPYDVSNKDGRTKREWKEDRPGRPNNDFFDCMAGAYVVAILQGIRPRKAGTPKRKRKIANLRELQQQKRRERDGRR